MSRRLAVRIDDGVTSRFVTDRVRGLKFRKTAPGGHADASCRIDVPRSTFPDLGPADRMWIFDRRTGATVWGAGYTNNPGGQTGPSGEGFDLSAAGGMTLGSDRSERLIYIDWSLDRWRRADNLAALTASATTEVADDPAVGEPALKAQFIAGTAIDNGARASFIYDAFKGSTQYGAAIGGRTRAGFTSSDYQMAFTTPSEYVMVRTASTSAAAGLYSQGLAWTTPADTFYCHLQHLTGGPTTPGNDTFWASFALMRVLGSRKNRAGTDLTISNLAYVLASDVVEDLLGRILTFCDPITSTITTTTYQIDQLAYFDATKAATVLDDLGLYEPDFIWEVLESNAAGLHRFNWRPWPTTYRYLIPPSVLVDQPGSDIDLCNRVAVNWTDKKGNPQVTTRGANVADLGNASPVMADGSLNPAFAGRIRDAEPVTLPEGRGSLTNAQRIGDQVLASKSSAPRAAKCSISQPIMDLDQGRYVQPFEIEPGYVARLMSTGDDLRLTEMEYDADACTASLTLGDPVLTIEQRIARLTKVAG